MPSASLLSTNMNNLVRDTYHGNGLIRSHQQLQTASQTSLQKISSASPKFMYSNNQVNQMQQQQHMQFPPPPPMATPLIPQGAHVPNQDSNGMASFNPLIVSQAQQQSLNVSHPVVLPQANGFASNSHTQSTILMSTLMANKNPQPNQHQYLQQHYHQQPQQQHQAQCSPVAQSTTTQQVPMTTVMIPASAAAQLQSASLQIQQAASQASGSIQNQPQIMVLMIPYMVNTPPTIPTTPEQYSLNSTLVRQSNNHSLPRQQSNSQQLAPQQQPQAPISATHSRAVSSLSNSKQAPEKFYIKTNFSYQATRVKTEISFQRGDILHVIDTLQNNDYGIQYWLATRVKPNGKDAEKGLIPNKAKAEELALEQRTLDIGEHGNTLDTNSSGVLSASVGRVNFLKRRAAQRSKSLCKDNWDNVVFDIGTFKLPTYERVIFKHPGFCRPVVIFGPLSDVAREKLLRDYPEKYSYPSEFNQTSDHPRVIRLKGVLDVINQGKHALLDITPSAVEKLNYVNLAPIVIFMKTDSKSVIKEFRSRAAKSLDPNARDEDTLRRDGKSSRKLLEQSLKLEKTWCHVFTAVLDLSTMGSEMWYRKLRETIENQQSANVWMSEKKSEKKNLNNNDDLVFPVAPDPNVSYVDTTNALSERFGDSLNLTNKSTSDLHPEGNYGNRSQLRNAYAHSLAQKLARASSEPKLNGLLGDHDIDDDEDNNNDDDDDDEIIKKPFPSEMENTSSLSSSNGATSYGQSSMSGSHLTYQHYPQQQSKSDIQGPSRNQQEGIYARNPMMNSTTNCNGMGSGMVSNNSNYHPLPSMPNENEYHLNQSMHSLNNNMGTNSNVIDLSRNHDIRGSAFQVYSDMNQNNYHYYNLNKI